MVRVVQTLWFETISVLSQPLIDTPVGMITIRQGLLVGAGAAAGYVVYRLASSLADPFLSTGIGLIPFVLCAMTAAKKVKTIPPEQYLLLLFRPRQRSGGRANRRSLGTGSPGPVGGRKAPPPQGRRVRPGAGRGPSSVGGHQGQGFGYARIRRRIRGR